MTTYNEPTITVQDWRGRDERLTLDEYLAKWATGSIDEVRRLAMWQGEADDVIAMERLEREFEELRQRIVQREFNRQYEKEHGHHILDSPYVDGLLKEWAES